MKKKDWRQLIIGSFIIFFIVGCSQYFMKDNPNVNTSLDAAKVDANALTSWYMDMYQMALNMNNDKTLTPDTREILETKFNPALDTFKGYLNSYLLSIKMIEADPVMAGMGIDDLDNLKRKLDMTKTLIVKYLMTIESEQQITVIR